MLIVAAVAAATVAGCGDPGPSGPMVDGKKIDAERNRNLSPQDQKLMTGKAQSR
ncbi:hypothetical protein [Fimbriimonas ginsengisoli]|uniref:Lipoprotein n=1 Tax=Fimbriimonas ginsengisoli Gsoil 348 TaxID=661478 RepID=A0A068NSS7_FIMGI|nr:hypothetical protein [Fimbriimonas ginsengisoli]AIE86486.1 hypothetical protein OP10G_3118 [Fimbriimonas ginsengisoli Gsoil 348]